MTSRDTGGWNGGRRSLIVGGIAAAHLLVLLAIAAPSIHAAPAEVPAMALLAFREPTPDAAPASSTVEAPAPVEVIAVEPALAIIAAEPIPAAPAAASTDPSNAGDCVASDAVQSALSAAPEVRQALAGVPSNQRSVADAVVVWNVTWAPLASADDAPLASVRNVVTRTLGGLPAACISEVVTGPRLFLIEAPGGMMVLTFGSGAWRWRDVTQKV